MNQPILIWINPYGAWAPELRHPVETIGYNQYLNAITDSITALKNQVKVAYMSGGMHDANGKTECETSIPELENRLAKRGVTDFEIRADEESVTSISIVRKFLETWQNEYADHLPILFCDEVRYPTNAYVLEYFAKKLGLTLPPTNQILVPLPRIDIHPNSTAEKQQEKIKAMQEKGVEAVEQEEIAQRK